MNLTTLWSERIRPSLSRNRGKLALAIGLAAGLSAELAIHQPTRSRIKDVLGEGWARFNCPDAECLELESPSGRREHIMDLCDPVCNAPQGDLDVCGCLTHRVRELCANACRNPKGFEVPSLDELRKIMRQQAERSKTNALQEI